MPAPLPHRLRTWIWRGNVLLLAGMLWIGVEATQPVPAGPRFEAPAPAPTPPDHRKEDAQRWLEATLARLAKFPERSRRQHAAPSTRPLKGSVAW